MIGDESINKFRSNQSYGILCMFLFLRVIGLHDLTQELRDHLLLGNFKQLLEFNLLLRLMFFFDDDSFNTKFALSLEFVPDVFK